MTLRAFSLARRLLAPLLAALSVASAVVVPVLDADDQSRRVVLESAHDGDACAPGHDHGICAQVAANAGVSTEIARHVPLEAAVARPPLRVTPRSSGRLDHSSSLGPRAPPLA